MLSCVLTHFDIPPRRVWYDNACNAFDSEIIRVPWLLRYTMLVVDRFHFNGHGCCNVFNGNMHPFLDEDRSVSAEVINAIIEKGTSHIAYLKGENVIPFMKILFSQINATAVVRDRTGRTDLEDCDLLHLFRQYFTCCCLVCTRNGIVSEQMSGEQPDRSSQAASDGVFIFSRDNNQVAVQDVEHAMALRALLEEQREPEHSYVSGDDDE